MTTSNSIKVKAPATGGSWATEVCNFFRAFLFMLVVLAILSFAGPQAEIA
jgi:hypothetical protein